MSRENRIHNFHTMRGIILLLEDAGIDALWFSQISLPAVFLKPPSSVVVRMRNAGIIVPHKPRPPHVRENIWTYGPYWKNFQQVAQRFATRGRLRSQQPGFKRAYFAYVPYRYTGFGPVVVQPGSSLSDHSSSPNPAPVPREQ